tara:strand:+ start:3818 stop:5473 length:1656 start_codon:yes stop_codon:yes gene_type:complete
MKTHQRLLLFALIIISWIFLVVSFNNCSSGKFNSYDQIDISSVDDDSTSSLVPPLSPIDNGVRENLIPQGNHVRYVRIDGGTAQECNGKMNVPYPGSGTNQACAWKHPRYALGYNSPTVGAANDISSRSASVVYIESGTYKIGYGMPDTPNCSTSYTYDCLLGRIPTGLTLQGNCSSRRKFSGRERLGLVLDLTGASDVTVKCLEITDGAECVENHMHGTGGSSYACNRSTYPHGEWASTGLVAGDSTNVVIDYVNIHGLGSRGMYAGRISNWEIKNSNIDGNGFVGFDGDITGDDYNSGYIKFYRTTVRWNGCVEKLDLSHTGCWGQESGGYGDGLGTGATRGDWDFDQVVFEYNTSDGLDLLYLKNGGTVKIRNSYFAHNAGNQVKTAAASWIENNVIIGDCSYHGIFSTMANGDLCRALGNAISIGVEANDTNIISNNTVTGEGDCLVLSGGTTGGTLKIDKNIFDGRTDWRQNNEKTCFHYTENSSMAVQVNSNLVFNTKGGCVNGQICASPLFTNPNFLNFNPTPLSSSAASGLGAQLSLLPIKFQ